MALVFDPTVFDEAVFEADGLAQITSTRTAVWDVFAIPPAPRVNGAEGYADGDVVATATSGGASGDAFFYVTPSAITATSAAARYGSRGYRHAAVTGTKSLLSLALPVQSLQVVSHRWVRI